MKKKRVLLIIPAYNEEEVIENTILEIEDFKKTLGYLSNEYEYSVDYIVINDGSTDCTPIILDKKKIKHIDLVKNLGIGGAVQTGYKYAFEQQYDIAIQFDGDGQHDINSIPELITPLLTGYDFCIGSRFVDKSASVFQTTFARRIGINIISFLIKLVTGHKIYDVTSGYRAANKKVIELFANRYPRNYPEPESIVNLYKKKYRIIEAPVNMRARAGGKSSITSLKSIKYMFEVGISIFILSFMKEND